MAFIVGPGSVDCVTEHVTRSTPGLTTLGGMRRARQRASGVDSGERDAERVRSNDKSEADNGGASA
jgi:hypothetical protein